MSTFRNKNLFGSGPHVFSFGPRGLESQPQWRLLGDSFSPGSGVIGALELEIVVTGRLVAASEAALWTLREAVVAEASPTLMGGTLLDNSGRTFLDMRLASYEETGGVVRGRAWSIGYAARFRRFAASYVS